MALDFGGTGKCESIQRTLWRPDDEYPILCRLLQIAGDYSWVLVPKEKWV